MRCRLRAQSSAIVADGDQKCCGEMSGHHAETVAELRNQVESQSVNLLFQSIDTHPPRTLTCSSELDGLLPPFSGRRDWESNSL